MVQPILILDQLILKNFKQMTSVDSFVGTTHTGGYGITLTAGSNMVYFSNGYDLEKRQQSEARIDRIGQTTKNDLH
jgi:SNF2 family DNA or RNA helicase